MINRGIFVATPISGFRSNSKYHMFRKNAIKLISHLKNRGYKVISEIESIESFGEYTAPEKSIREDFGNIESNEFFILLHPERLQTSSLIEFGYACALEKKIIVIGRSADMPYLVMGYLQYSNKAILIEEENVVEYNYDRVIEELKALESV